MLWLELKHQKNPSAKAADFGQKSLELRISSGFVEILGCFFWSKVCEVMAVALFSSMLLVVCVAKCAKERVQRCVYGMMKAVSSWDWWDGSHETQHSKNRSVSFVETISIPQKSITFYCNLMCDHIIIISSHPQTLCVFSYLACISNVNFRDLIVSLSPPLKQR